MSEPKLVDVEDFRWGEGTTCKYKDALGFHHEVINCQCGQQYDIAYYNPCPYCGRRADGKMLPVFDMPVSVIESDDNYNFASAKLDADHWRRMIGQNE